MATYPQYTSSPPYYQPQPAPGAYNQPYNQQGNVVVVDARTPLISAQQPRSISFTVPFLLSIIVCCFCGCVVGLIAFVLALLGQNAAAAGDDDGARKMYRASLIVSFLGIGIGILVIAIVLPVTLNCPFGYYNNNGFRYCCPTNFNNCPYGWQWNDGCRVCRSYHQGGDSNLQGENSDTSVELYANRCGAVNCTSGFYHRDGCRVCCDAFDENTCSRGWKWENGNCKACCNSWDLSIYCHKRLLLSSSGNVGSDLINCGNPTCPYGFYHSDGCRVCCDPFNSSSCSLGWKWYNGNCRACCTSGDLPYYCFGKAVGTGLLGSDPEDTKCDNPECPYGFYHRDGCRECCNQFDQKSCSNGWKWYNGNCKTCCGTADLSYYCHRNDMSQNVGSSSNELQSTGCKDPVCSYGYYHVDGCKVCCDAFNSSSCAFGWKWYNGNCRTCCSGNDYPFYCYGSELRANLDPETGLTTCGDPPNCPYGSYDRDGCQVCCDPFDGRTCSRGWKWYNGNCKACCNDREPPFVCNKQTSTLKKSSGVSTDLIKCDNPNCTYGFYHRDGCKVCCDAFDPNKCDRGWKWYNGKCRSCCSANDLPYYCFGNGGQVGEQLLGSSVDLSCRNVECPYGYYHRDGCRECCNYFDEKACPNRWRYYNGNCRACCNPGDRCFARNELGSSPSSDLTKCQNPTTCTSGFYFHNGCKQCCNDFKAENCTSGWKWYNGNCRTCCGSFDLYRYCYGSKG